LVSGRAIMLSPERIKGTPVNHKGASPAGKFFEGKKTNSKNSVLTKKLQKKRITTTGGRPA